MLQHPQDYFTVADIWEAPPGIVLFGHSPTPDTPWPKPDEEVEMRSPNGAAFKINILETEEASSSFPGANPANRLILVARDSVQTMSLKGFHVRALHPQEEQTSWIKRLTQAIGLG